MGETLIIQNVELYKALLMDKIILATVFFVLLMVSAFCKSAVKRVPYREMFGLSLFFAVLLALYAPKISAVIGNGIFGLVFAIGQVEKELWVILKRFTIAKIESYASKDPAYNKNSKNTKTTKTITTIEERKK